VSAWSVVRLRRGSIDIVEASQTASQPASTRAQCSTAAELRAAGRPPATGRLQSDQSTEKRSEVRAARVVGLSIDESLSR